MAGTTTPGYTFGSTEQVTATKLASLATGTVSGIVNADIASDAAIADSKLAQITTAAKVSGTAITGAIANGVTATTQPQADNSTKLATTAYVDATRYKIGTFSRDMSLASGTQAITGVGFRPGVVLFTATENGVAGVASFMGFDNGTTHENMYDIANQTAGAYESGIANSIFIKDVTYSNQYGGYISSMDNDGFTITWTKTNTPTGTLNINYLALR